MDVFTRRCGCGAILRRHEGCSKCAAAERDRVQLARAHEAPPDAGRRDLDRKGEHSLWPWFVVPLKGPPSTRSIDHRDVKLEDFFIGVDPGLPTSPAWAAMLKEPPEKLRISMPRNHGRTHMLKALQDIKQHAEEQGFTVASDPPFEFTAYAQTGKSWDEPLPRHDDRLEDSYFSREFVRKAAEPSPYFPDPDWFKTIERALHRSKSRARLSAYIYQHDVPAHSLDLILTAVMESDDSFNRSSKVTISQFELMKTHDGVREAWCRVAETLLSDWQAMYEALVRRSYANART